jgi:PAS domain S-box-containing protein
MSTAYTSTDFGIAGAWLAEYTIDALGAGIVVFDSLGQMLQWNAHAPSLLALDPETMAGLTMTEQAWPVTDMAGRPFEPGDGPIADVLQTGESMATTIVVPLPDGGRRTIAMRVLPVFSHDGSTRGAIASLVVREVVEPATACPPRNPDQFASFEYSLLARLVVDTAGRIVDWNRQLLALTGHDDAALVERCFEEICNLDLGWMWSSLESANGEPMEGWISIRPAGRGSMVPVFGHFRLVADAEAGPLMSIELIDPAELRHPSSRTATLLGTEVFAAAAVPMLAIDDGGEIVDVNEAAAGLIGRPVAQLRQEQIGRYVDGLAGSDLRELVVAARATTTTVDAGRRRARRAGGTEVQVEVSVRALRDGVRWPILLVQLLP